MRDSGGGATTVAPSDLKFAVPLATHVVPRPRLHARLTAGLECSCTLIAAPAGWGKTLLAGSWLADGAAGRAAAWVSLGPAEDDVRALWIAVATAVAPVVGERAAAGLRRVVTGEDVENMPGQIATILTDDRTPVVLVLDNLHEITSFAVHESLLRLVQRPPPGLRFVATTRRDPPWPLDRLRLAGMITEVRAAELAFRVDETEALFAQLGLDLAGAHVGRLVERTEGWAAGLRLAALQLQGVADPAGFVDAFSGDDHAVAAYLLTEVLDQQTPELLQFLVRVSFVDLVSADLADALTGTRTGAATLAELAASNLFVQAVGPGGRWYRLHRLIADLLRTRITDPRALRDLHRRAAEWYRRHSMPLDAVRYALRGGLWPLAAELVGTHIVAFAIRGSARELDLLLSAVPRDSLLRHPELAAGLAAARTQQGSNREVKELVAAALVGLDDLPRPRAERLRVVLDLLQIGHARIRGDFVAMLAAIRRVPDDPRTLSSLGLTGWDLLPLLVLSNRGTAELWTGNMAEAEKHLRAAVDANQWSGLLRPHLNAAAQLALLLSERGELDAAEADAQAVVDRAAEAGWASSAQAVAAYLALAWVSLDRSEPEGIDRWLGKVAEVEAITPEPHVQLAAAALNALRRADAGDREGAHTGLRTATSALVGAAPPVLADRVLLVEAELLRSTGDLQQAAEVLTQLRGPPTPHTAHAHARLQIAAGDAAAAEQLLAPFPPERATVRQRVDGGIVRTLITAALDRGAALQLLEDALLAAAPVGMRRPFLVESADLKALLGDRIEAGTGVTAFAVSLLQRMSGQHRLPPTSPGTFVDALTEREHVVLRYLPSRLSNAEIAAELYLSVNTIKTHQRMVYRKLGAASRRDAVRRAKQLRIL
ncbi:MAG TPA: LuxR C-terminal-related transcriptional regulator [Actinophytocola sp.]|nr:LuxR C-terminal-related transcriptional regulator [Actinophytocola sp.]